MRPKWVRGVTDKAALLEAEHTTFMEWRRRLSLIEETYDVTMTPYEKNPFFWRQLWRVVERSLFLAHVRARVRVCARVHSLSFSLSLFCLSLALIRSLSRARALPPSLSPSLSPSCAFALSPSLLSRLHSPSHKYTYICTLQERCVYNKYTYSEYKRCMCICEKESAYTHILESRAGSCTLKELCYT